MLQSEFRSVPHGSHSGTQTEGTSGSNSSHGEWQKQKRQAKTLLRSQPLTFLWLRQAKAKDSRAGNRLTSGKPWQGQTRKEGLCTDNKIRAPQGESGKCLCTTGLSLRRDWTRVLNRQQCWGRWGRGSSSMTFFLYIRSSTQPFFI